MKLLKGVLIVFISSVIVLGTEKVDGQEEEKRQIGCKILDKSNDAIYITYERLEEDKEKGGSPEVILRLRNNTDCPIIVETLDDVTEEARQYDFTKEERLEKAISYCEISYGRVKREVFDVESNGFSVRYIPEFLDGVKLPLIYTVYDYNDGSIKPGNTENIGGGCLSYNYTIAPSQSVCFSTNIDYFQFSDVVLSFEFEWEKDDGYSYESSHKVSFDRESLPKQVMKMFNIKSRLQID